jgi:hypothetical protein
MIDVCPAKKNKFFSTCKVVDRGKQVASEESATVTSCCCATSFFDCSTSRRRADTGSDYGRP